MPYFFDIVDYGTISNAELKGHIDRVGVTIFARLRACCTTDRLLLEYEGGLTWNKHQ